MRDSFYAREQQLVQVSRALAESEARNAAESRELTVMLQECRSLPTVMPPSPSPRSPVATSALPLPHPHSHQGQHQALALRQHGVILAKIWPHTKARLVHHQ